MKKILISLIATAAVVVLPGVANAGPQPEAYFVAKFEGKSNAKLALKVTDDEVSDIGFRSRIPCGRGGIVYGGFDPAQLVNGRFSSEVKYPALQPGNVFRLRGRGVPGSPAGKLRLRTRLLNGKTCGSTKKWSALEVSKARWDRYRDKAGIG